MTAKQNESISKSQNMTKCASGKTEKDKIDSIILLAKTPGLTSFVSLRNVKKALNTTKVGHTGTLDSFAEGLLVVCAGRLTKLAGRITEFYKTYEAVIHFGSETDTLEYTGNVVKTAPLPTEDALREAVKKWTGEIDQKPPAFSAIHVDGKRASDLARSGKDVEIPARRVTVFSAEIKELRFAGDFVEYAHIVFSVSKGTYIRSLARDIAESCGSAAHLTGLYRTKVGNFRVEDSAGFDFLGDFNIDSAISKEKEFHINTQNSETKKDSFVQNDDIIQAEILKKRKSLSEENAKLCGFEIIHLKNRASLENFKNGKPLRSELFETSLWDYPKDSEIAVFFSGEFFGVINKNAEGKLNYGFVLN